MRERLAKWWKAQADVLTLEGLDDRMLEDMGIGRGEIRRRVLGPEEEAAAAGTLRRAAWAEDAC